MTPEQNKAIVRRMNFEFIQGRKREVAEEILADTFVNHTTPPGLSAGPEGVQAFFELLWRGFPDLSVEIVHQVADGDLVGTHKAFHGTHTGVFMGISPTGKRVRIEVMDTIRLENGRFVEHWGIVDQAGLMAQLGVSPAAGQ
jgi:predicted ester cyclase